MADNKVLDWLLSRDQPSVRYYALTELLDLKKNDHDVREASSNIKTTGWAADLLSGLGKDGFWEEHEPNNLQEWVTFSYFPKFQSTFWKALVLSDLGLDSTDIRIKKIADVMFDYKLKLGSPVNFFLEEVSVSGNIARMLTRFGYLDDPRVRRLYDWLMDDQREDGGWNVEQGFPGSLEAFEALAAFASVPIEMRSPKMSRAIERGAEFYLDRQLYEDGLNHDSWFQFHYPNHYYYDILVGLDVLTQLGYSDDKRLKPAIGKLKKKRQQNGTWILDKIPPDTDGESYNAGFGSIQPLVVEPVGKPSKWITLTALRVLKRVDEAT